MKCPKCKSKNIDQLRMQTGKIYKFQKIARFVLWIGNIVVLLYILKELLK